jgi:hypothetical protein
MTLHLKFQLRSFSMARFARTGLCAVALAAGATRTAQAQVPAEFTGDWVPASAMCSSPARIRVEAAKITLVNGTDSESFGGIEMAGPGYFGPDYRGISAVAIAELDKDAPVQMVFNYNEKKGVAQADMASPIAGNVNAVGKALNARLAKLNLVKRFPLNQVPLKKCAAAPAR